MRLARYFVKHRQVDLVLQSFCYIYRNNPNWLFILGIMGSGMVKNLLNSGHNVTVWNRTTEKVRYMTESHDQRKTVNLFATFK